MRGLITLLVSAAIAILFASEALAIDCLPVEGREMRTFNGEVSGQNSFYLELGNGWAFALVPRPFGWDIEVRDTSPYGPDIELSWITPPRMSPNPREIYGWHFRNADNTGPNRGEVNAPQLLRLFEFYAGADAVPANGEGLPPEGRGALEIHDFGLADLDEGQQARMVYLKFSVCMGWPEGAGQTMPQVSAETLEIFGACGLESPLSVSPFLSNFEFEGDFDGDGSWDRAALVTREGDGKRGIAVCRAGTWLDILGIAGDIGEFQPAYMESVDWWSLVPKGPVGANASGEAPPILLGDAILIGKQDSSSVMLYWNGDSFASYWQGD